jgi:hypothetical protein
MFLLNTKKKNPENISDSFDKFLKKDVLESYQSTESEKSIPFENGLVPSFSKNSLFYKKEPTVSLGTFSYLGNDYFIGFLNQSTILQIKLYNELYKIWIHPKLELHIIEVNKAVDSDLVVIKTLHDEYLDNLKIIDLITPDHFLSCEQLSNKYACLDENGNENWLRVEKITVQFFIVDNLLNMVRGALLLSKNRVVGMFSHVEGQKHFFIRLSHVYEWISKFVPNFRDKSVYSINPQVPFYTKEQLLIIISHLNHKIDSFTTKLDELDKNSLKTSFKLLADSNEIKKEEQLQNMIETINHLNNKVNAQEQQIKHIMTVLKKLGFNQ